MKGKYRAYRGKVKYFKPKDPRRCYQLPEDYDAEREIVEALQMIEEGGK